MIFDNKALEGENARLREALAAEQLRVAELTKALIALSDRAAFRALYPSEKKEDVMQKAATLFSFDPRKTFHKAPVSFDEVGEQMAKRVEEGKL